ncbi:MAG: transglutaminase family protein [Planctomycetota bacterium]|nr:MAG: transglutaminase family protein [Planctomycetota bacterium]
MRYAFVHTTHYSYSDAVPLCQNQVHLKPRDSDRQICHAHELAISPVPFKVDESRDFFGNPIHFFTLQDRHELLSITSRGEVELRELPSAAPDDTGPWEKVVGLPDGPDGMPLDVRQFVYDSPHVALSSELADYTRESFPPDRPWLAGVLELMSRIHQDFAYDPTATNISTPLETVLVLRRGVCQDFAHLQLGCLRSLGLPARYVSGYLRTTPPAGQPRLIGADASHAWVSAWCPEFGWIDFDPTNDVVPSQGHITVAWGRDYSDVCPINGVFIGGGEHSMKVAVDVEPIPS